MHKLRTWYFSPLPEEYQYIECLYVCSFCLAFFVTENEISRHSERCLRRYPPGDQIYKDDKVAMFELNGIKHQAYCENVSYIAKFFLDHKNLFLEIDPFDFYVLTEHDENGYHFCGYFSKDRNDPENNLSCIMVMPFIQRGGYGKFLIEFSYALSLKEGKPGTPERPLSDLGHRSYMSWWSIKILKLLLEEDSSQLSIDDISNKTAILQRDVVYVLENLKILQYHQGNYYLFTEKSFLKRLLENAGRPGRPVITENIHWAPFTQKELDVNKH